MAKKVLTGTVTVTDDDGAHTYPAGSTPPDKHAKLITNESAWREASEDADVLVLDDQTRTQLLNAAENVGLEPGKDFPKTASKEVIAAEIKRKLFTEANGEAELTGDTPSELAAATAGGETTVAERRRSGGGSE